MARLYNPYSCNCSAFVLRLATGVFLSPMRSATFLNASSDTGIVQRVRRALQKSPTLLKTSVKGVRGLSRSSSKHFHHGTTVGSSSATSITGRVLPPPLTQQHLHHRRLLLATPPVIFHSLAIIIIFRSASDDVMYSFEYS